MPPLPAGYVRKGRPLNFQLDPDAVEMLYAFIPPTTKGHGKYLSELIRRDAIRRQEWQQMRDVQQAALVEVAGG
jgi:hypothetical protein